VRRDILEEHDGPMLRYGIQQLAGQRMAIPRERRAQPDPDRLQLRYERYLAGMR
jgi:putative restriction endonuclease